jgi:hypothetical protein
MKKFFIITAVLLVATTIIVSCQKEDILSKKQTGTPSKTLYQPPKVDDIDAYLRDFKLKMQTRGTDETMDLEEAAWHLSSIANCDFGDVDRYYANLHYDTLYYNINVENNKVSISDLNTLYTRIADDIATYFRNLDLDNKHIHFIDADISENGSVVMSIMVSYDWMDYSWFFPDIFVEDSILGQYFSEDSIYYMTGNFTSELQRVLNILTGHPTNPNSGKIYYVYSHTDSLMYYDYVDPHGSPNCDNYMIFTDCGHSSIIYYPEIKYYCSAYAYLGVLNSHADVILDWTINLRNKVPPINITLYHTPTIRYAHVVSPNPPNPKK